MDNSVEFQAEVSGCLDSLHGYAMLLTRSPQDAEDLLQDSLVRAFRGFDSFDRSLSFKAWTLRIVRNTHVDRQRRRKARPVEEHFWGEDEPPGASLESPLYSIPLAPEDILLRRETIERVRDGIRRLPPPMREVVELRDIEGLSYLEIAAIVDRPVGTVMSRLYRGRNLLRTFLVEPRRQDAPAQVRHEL